MEEYKPNSNKSKEEQKNAVTQKRSVEKVVSGEAKVRSRNGVRKLVDIFVPEDVEDVKRYILVDVIVPMIKKGLEDTFHAMLYGTSVPVKKNQNGRTAYSSISYRGDSSNRGVETRGRFSFDDIVLDSRGDAESVLSSLEDMIEMYGTASVADLYDLIGVTRSAIDYKYGWADMSGARAVPVRDGYLLKLPKAMPLD